MEMTLSTLPAIPVEFVTGLAQSKTSDAQRKPYVELVKSWAEHEGMEAEAQAVLRRMSSVAQIDADHMPKEFYQTYRHGEKAQQLIDILRHIDEVIASGEEMWTWAHVMRVMTDESILMATVSVNRFDTIICSMIPGKGKDSVRKNGDYSIMGDRDYSYHTWAANASVNATQASNREICEQIVEQFKPIIGRGRSA